MKRNFSYSPIFFILIIFLVISVIGCGDDNNIIVIPTAVPTVIPTAIPTVTAVPEITINFEVIDSGTDKNLNDIFFASETIGYIAADDRLVLKTTDGGNTWTKVMEPLELPLLKEGQTIDWENILSIAASTTNPLLVTVAGERGYVSNSNDGGQNWTVPQNAGFASDNFVGLAATPDFSSLIMAGDKKSVAVSTDKGETFQISAIEVVPSNATMNVGDTQTFQADTTFIVGKAGNVIRSKDDGNTWEKLSTPTTEDLVSVAAYEDTVLVASINGTIIGSTNGGDSFQKLNTIEVTPSNATMNVNDTQVFQAEGFVEVFMVGKDGVLMYSYDSGVSWVKITTDTIQDLKAVALRNNKEIIVTGSNGKILKGTIVRK